MLSCFQSAVPRIRLCSESEEETILQMGNQKVSDSFVSRQTRASDLRLNVFLDGHFSSKILLLLHSNSVVDKEK